MEKRISHIFLKTDLKIATVFILSESLWKISRPTVIKKSAIFLINILIVARIFLSRKIFFVLL